MRRVLIPAVLAGLLLIGCTSGEDETSDGSAQPDTTTDDTTDDTTGDTTGDTTDVTIEPPTGPAPGVTDDRVLIGVNVVDTEALKASGINIATGDIQGAFKALTTKINDAGGIHGRQVELVFALIDPTSPQPAEDACLKLTEDDDVFATVGFFLGEGVVCTIDTHATAVVGGTQSPDLLDRAKAPWFAFESNDSELDAISAFAEAGDLDGNVALVSSIADSASIGRIEAQFESLGIELVTKAVIDAPPDDTVAMQNAVLAIAESFEAADVDTVVAVGTSPTQFASNIQDQPYRPKLLATNDTIGAFVQSDATRDFSVLDGALAAGPYGPDQAIYEEAAMQECVAFLESAGIEIIAPDDADEGQQPYYAAFESCRVMTLLEALLEGAGPTLNYGTFAQAGAQLGEIVIPGNPDPANYGPESPDGNLTQYISAWDPDSLYFIPR